MIFQCKQCKRGVRVQVGSAEDIKKRLMDQGFSEPYALKVAWRDRTEPKLPEGIEVLCACCEDGCGSMDSPCDRYASEVMEPAW